MDHFHPELLSLQDMVGSDDEDNFSKNPFNIMNFFQPPKSPSKKPSSIGAKTKSGSDQATTSPVSGSSFSPNAFDNSSKAATTILQKIKTEFNPFSSSFHQSTSSSFITSILNIKTESSEDSPHDDILTYVNQEFRTPEKSHCLSLEEVVSDSGSDVDLDFMDEVPSTSPVQRTSSSAKTDLKTLDEKEKSSSSDDGVFKVPLPVSQFRYSPRKKSESPSPPKSDKLRNSPRLSSKVKKNLVTSLKPRKSRSRSKSPKRSKSKQATQQDVSSELNEYIQIAGGSEPTNEIKKSGEHSAESIERKKLRALKKKQLELQYSRKSCIAQLSSLIVVLQRYSNRLEDFLNNEGQQIIEKHQAITTLAGLFPELTSKSWENHPLQTAFVIGDAIMGRTKGKDVVSTLPLKKAVLWRTSDLLLLQQFVLESVIHHRQFFLMCRYTELLTTMGFNSEDLTHLQKFNTMESELIAIKSLIEDHNLQSKLSSSTKKPIQTIILKQDFKTGAPAFVSLPSPESLVKERWRLMQDIKKNTLLSTLDENDIDWLYVLKRMSIKNPLFKVDEASCKRAYNHYINFNVTRKPWTQAELLKLRTICNKNAENNWDEIAKLLGTNRSAFACFSKYRIYCVPDDNVITLSPRMARKFEQYMMKYNGDVSRVDHEMCKDPEYKITVSPNSFLYYYNITYHPRLRKGQFTLVEDVLLFVAMENHKGIMLKGSQDGFLPIGYTLPWRYATTWGIRFSTIMTGVYFKPWTIEEDQQLISLVEKHGSNYKLVVESFPGRKRMQCRTRYLLLANALQKVSLEEYHVTYRNPKEGFRVKKLKQILGFLETAIALKTSSPLTYVRKTADLEFLKIRRPPTDRNLDKYLMSFPLSVLQATSQRMCNCFKAILKNYDQLLGKASSKLPTTDRRKFFQTCPISVASALHFRRAKLISREMLGELTKFEEEVYSNFQYFSARGLPKKKTVRPSIPTLDNMAKLPSLKRLIEPPPPDPSGPVIILSVETIKTEPEEFVEKEEPAVCKKPRRARGRSKQAKLRESRVRAANIRWANQKSSQEQGTVDDNSASVDTSPATPSSVTSESEACRGKLHREAVVGAICDHDYSSRILGPSELEHMTLHELFEKFGNQQRPREQVAGNC